jgi:dihydroorotase-like cyclic amidohydrolase
VTVLDGAGNSFIPRFADMHVHLNGTGEPSASREFVEGIRNTEKSAPLL